jgi:fused signal recognition particle receptor
MILWWGKKKKPDPKTGETPVEPLRPGERPVSALDPPSREPPVALAGQAVNPASEPPAPAPATAPPQPDFDPDDPIGLKRAAERIARERGPISAPSAAFARSVETDVLAALQSGLAKTSSRLADGISAALSSRRLDRATLEELEEILIASDMGASVASRLTQAISKGRFDREVSEEEVREALAVEIEAILKPREKIVDFATGHIPRIVLFVGVNGSGKTTTIGKIASKLAAQGADVTLAAGDTFRAAAIEQLKVWADRAGARFVARPQGSDAAALAWEAVDIAKRESRDLVLIDTAGRLQNRTELMDELGKVVRAIRKLDASAPHDVILVLDATVGQNALSQVEAFRTTANVTGIVMTKLDGTAKGGVLVAIADKYDLPIHFVGVGERAEDLQPFSAAAFARALVGLARPG